MRKTVNIYKRNKAVVLIPLIIATLFSVVFFASHVFSLGDLEMEITYKGETWNGDSEFTPEWFTNEDEVTFMVDLSRHYNSEHHEEGAVEEPFEIVAEYDGQHGALINTRIIPNVSDEGEFGGVYEVTMDLSRKWPARLHDGNLNIDIEIKDENDWEIPVDRVQFFIIRDTTDPEISVEGITDGEIFHPEDSGGDPVFPTLAVEVDDHNFKSGIISIKVNGKESYLPFEDTKFSHQFLDDGKYEVRVMAIDKAGNSQSTEEITFYIQNGEPELTVTADGEPISESEFFNTTKDFYFHITNIIPIHKAEVNVVKDGRDQRKLPFDIEGETATLSHEFTEDGTYELTVIVTGKLKGTTITHELGPIEFTIDATPPDISILEILDSKKVPVRGGLSESKTVIVEVDERNFDEDKATIEVIDEDNESTTLTPNWDEGEGNKYTSSSFDFTEEGEYTVKVNVQDLAGNESESNSKTFAIDQTAPNIVISGVENDVHYKEHKEVDIKVTDLHLDQDNTTVTIVNLTEDNREQEVEFEFPDEQTATLTHPFDEDGTYQITVSAIDLVGNKAEDQVVTFTIDTIKPDISILQDDGVDVVGDISKGKTVDIQVVEKHFEDKNATVEIIDEDNEVHRMNPEWVKGDHDTYTSSFDFTEEGKYTVNVSVHDLAGNESQSKSATFTIDQTAPDISLTGVKNDEHYNENKKVDINVTDLHLDQDNTTVKIENLTENREQEAELDFPDDQTARFSSNFDEEGTYKITVSSVDLAGNKADDQVVTFTIDKTAPVLSIEPIKDGSFYNSNQEVTVSVDEENYQTNNVIFTVTQNGEDITSEVDPSEDTWWKKGERSELTYDFDEDGFYTISIEATDKAGNKAKEIAKEFTIDQTSPVIEITGVENNVHYDETMPVEVTITDVDLDENLIEVTKDGKDYDVGDFTISNWGTVASLEHEFSEEGDYVIKVEATDKAGNHSNKEISFTIDKTDPMIDIRPDKSITSHVTSEFINEQEEGINDLIDIQLNELNVKSRSVTLKHVTMKGKESTLKNSEIGRWDSTGKGQFEFIFKDHLFDVDGVYTIKVSATDKSGRKAKEEFAFTVDNIKPVITLTNIAKYNAAPVTETVTVREHNFKKNNVTIDIYRANANGKFVPYDDNFNEWENKSEKTSLDFPFKEDGKYKIVVNATDDAGNKADEKSNIFTIDTIDPVLSIKGVENTKHYNKNKRVTVEVKDANIDKKATNLEIKKLNHSTGKMENYKTKEKLEFTKTKARFNHNFNREGTYSIKISATDKAGNEAKDKEVTFVIDKTAPVLSIDNVKNNAYYATSKNVTISVNELNFATNNVTFSVSKDGQDITSQVEQRTGSKWRNASRRSKLSYNFNEDGFYVINIRAKDAAGNVATSRQMKFTIDTTNPTIDINGVENNAYYNVDKPVNITIKDVNFKTNTIRVTRNGSNYPIGNFSVTNNRFANSVATLNHTFSQEGVYEVFVESIDRAGNRVSDRVTFTIDKTDPVITPIMKGDGTVITDGQYINKVFTPEFILDNPEDEIVSVTLNNGPNIVGKIPVASQEMVYNYKVLARDKAGNETTLNIRFTLDTTKPTLTITGVLDGFFNDKISPTVTFSDKNLDESRTSVTLNGQPFVNGTVLEEEKDYILKAVITDLAGNVSEKTIVFTIDKTAPVIKFKEALSEKYFNETVIPEILIQDMTDYDIIALTLNGEPYTLGDPIETEGKHVLYFEVKDKAGNIKQLTVEFIIDKTPPVVLFEGAEHDGQYFEAIDLKIWLDNPEDTIKSIKVNGELYEGEVIEEDGYSVIQLQLSDVDSYDIEVEAYDEAGNTVTTVLSFEIAEKSMIVKFYENKPLFAGTIVGLLALVATGGALAVRLRNKGSKSDEELAEIAE